MSDQVSVVEASEEAKVPRTTIYRWVRSKAIRSHRNGEMLTVSLADVKRVAAARLAGPVPEISGTPTGRTDGQTDSEKMEQAANRQPPPPLQGAAGTKAASLLNGEEQSFALARFQEGKDPISTAIEMKIDLSRILDLHAQWERALEKTQPREDRVTKLAQFVRDLEDHRIDPMSMLLDKLEQGQFELARQVAQLSERLGAVPAPTHRDDFACPYGHTTYYGILLRCTVPGCGGERVWGFHPPRR